MGQFVFFSASVTWVKTFFGGGSSAKLTITPTLLLRMVSLFDISKPIQVAIRALFLVAFFSFLRKSNLVVQSDHVISPKVPRRSDLHVSQYGAFLSYSRD